MFLVESLSKGIAQSIVKHIDGDKEKEEIITYGAFCLIQTLWAILVTVIFALIFNVLTEALIVCFAISILRKYSGGVHASSPNSCAVIGSIICVVLSKLAIKISLFLSVKYIIFLGFICFIYSYFIVKKLAPVDSPAKPISKEEKRQALKKQSIKILFIMYTISMLLTCIYFKLNSNTILKYTICIYLGTAWQTFSLTAIAHFLLKKVDYAFIKTVSVFNTSSKNS